MLNIQIKEHINFVLGQSVLQNLLEVGDQSIALFSHRKDILKATKMLLLVYQRWSLANNSLNHSPNYQCSGRIGMSVQSREVVRKVRFLPVTILKRNLLPNYGQKTRVWLRQYSRNSREEASSQGLKGLEETSLSSYIFYLPYYAWLDNKDLQIAAVEVQISL